jgi:hypothetical protein
MHGCMQLLLTDLRQSGPVLQPIGTVVSLYRFLHWEAAD